MGITWTHLESVWNPSVPLLHKPVTGSGTIFCPFLQQTGSNLFSFCFTAHASLYTSNVLIGMLYLFAGGDGAGATFGLALVYWFLFTPASYMCWFRPVYKAFRDDSSMYFMVFFFTFFFQFLLTILFCLGIGSMGGR